MTGVIKIEHYVELRDRLAQAAAEVSAAQQKRRRDFFTVLNLGTQKQVATTLAVITELQGLPMHLETLHATHIGRTMTAAKKSLASILAADPGNADAATAERLASTTLEVWRDIATSANYRLKQRRMREAIADVASGNSMTPFERMTIVREIKTAGRVEKKFGAGFDTSKYTSSAAASAPSAASGVATVTSDAVRGSGAGSPPSSAPAAAASRPAHSKNKQIPRLQGRLGEFFATTNTRGVSSAAARSTKRFSAHASAHVAEKRRQTSLRAKTAPRDSSSSEGELSDIS